MGANKLKIAQNKRKREQLQMQKKQQKQLPNPSSKRKNANARDNAATKKKARPVVKKRIIKGRNGKAVPLQDVKNKLQQNKNSTLKKREIRAPITSTKSVAKENEKLKSIVKEKEQYELSEYDSDFSESDEDEDARGKFIPDWAQKKAPCKSIMRQKCIDPDTIFGKILLKTVDLEEIFQDYPSRTKYRQRSSS